MSDKKTGDGRYAYDGLDRVLHEKARLGIVTSLAARADGLLFTDLKNLCHLTDGNLSRHLMCCRRPGSSRSTRASAASGRRRCAA